MKRFSKLIIIEHRHSSCLCSFTAAARWMRKAMKELSVTLVAVEISVTVKKFYFLFFKTINIKSYQINLTMTL